MIRPCFLPVGMSTSNRIIKPGYESYQPVVVARQFGLGQVPPHFFLHHLTVSRAELPDILTGQRCYTFFDALAIPIPHNLCFTITTDGFETWWSMWKTHAYRRALGPLLRQLDAEYDVPAHQGCDLSSLLTFDPESIEPATSKAGEERSPSTVHGPLQRLKALLSSSVETLVENPEAIKGILEDIQPHLPVTLQVKLWPAVTLSVFRSRVQSARQRIILRHAQLPLRADIAEKCQRLNEKKAALDVKTDTSANSAELETLRKELEDLEERVRVTKQLIQDKETLIARSQEEAKGLTADRRPIG
ncbi:hypothetical protein QYE76_069498 [Lolium multiflorum]|uniref:Uncharacterized protein n=1 Tax=Lolium multiflorum TaxID=4521 RepID=A0AAD8WD00_LOLMU|nr:hypothetical protein QYE76_069498 [Lolium multiflorum]